MAAIGPVERFPGPDRLVAYFGLNPSVHQSGEGRPRHWRITKQGRSLVRTMLVEAAWQAVRGLGPLRAFYQRVSSRRGTHVAAVAVARKLAVIIWHLLTRGEDYAWLRPALHAKKLRNLEPRSGEPARRGQRGAAYAYNLSRTRWRRSAAPSPATPHYETPPVSTFSAHVPARGFASCCPSHRAVG